MLTPTGDTAQLLRGYRLLFGAKNRSQPSKFEVLREFVDDTTPLIDLPANLLLRFEISLSNKDFVNFTILPAKQQDEIYLLRNTPSNPILTLQVMRYASGGLRLDGLSANEIVTITTPFGNSFTSQAFEGDAGWVASIDFDKYPAGIFQINSSLGTQSVYVDAQLNGKDLFGILHLQQGGGNTIDAKYSFEFQTQVARWKYFVKLSGNHTAWEYEINAPSGLDFDPYIFPVVPPGQLPTDVGNILRTLLGPSESLVGFISTSDIAYRDVVRSSIALRRKLAPGAIGYPSITPVVVMKDLPNPSPGSATASVVVSVGPPL